MKQFIMRYRHASLWLVYMFFFLLGFFYIEQTVTSQYHMVHMALDDYIPFCELFVLPYFLWFPYMAGSVLYFLFMDKKEYYRNFAALAFGMTLFLAVSLFYPNGHNLRPAIMPRDNILTSLVNFLYGIDTSTNILPSIHVYDSVIAHLSIVHCQSLQNKKWMHAVSFAICTSISLSTVMIKQHSAVDVITGAALAAIVYLILYCPYTASSFYKTRS